MDELINLLKEEIRCCDIWDDWQEGKVAGLVIALEIAQRIKIKYYKEKYDE